MYIVDHRPKSFHRRNPDMVCWRISAIYRCCIRYGKTKAWALRKLREISPEGYRDHMADVWFADIDSVRLRHLARQHKKFGSRHEDISLVA